MRYFIAGSVFPKRCQVEHLDITLVQEQILVLILNLLAEIS